MRAGDVYEDFPDDEESVNVNDDAALALQVAQKIREAANTLYKAQKLDAALDKYESGCRHVFVGTHAADAAQRPCDTSTCITGPSRTPRSRGSTTTCSCPSC
jgi:hypothetical protein